MTEPIETVVDDRPIEAVIEDTMTQAQIADAAEQAAWDAEDEANERLRVEATINGATPQLVGPPCKHPTLTFQNVAGTVDDDEGRVLKWVLRVRVRCSLCGVPFDAVLDSVREPQDHPIGIVFDLLPVTDPALAESLPPHVDDD